jgi:hypothetical protein
VRTVIGLFLQLAVGVGPQLIAAGPWTGSVGGQTATDPDHRTADCTANSPLRLTAGCDESLPTDRLTLFAPALPLDVNVVGMDQHLRNHLLSNLFVFARRPAGLCYALRVVWRGPRLTPRRLYLS